MADTATLQLKVDSRQALSAADSLDDLTESGARAEGQIKDLSSASKKVGAPLRSIGDSASKAKPKMGGLANSLRQTSLQMSQVAQQGAVTGNFLQAFIIQIPDLLLPFGTLAIVIGAVAGAMGGPLITALTGTSSAIKTLEKDMGSLQVSFDKLTESQRGFLILQSETRSLALSKSLKTLSTDLEKAEKKLKDNENGVKLISGGYGIANTTIKTTSKEMKKLRDAVTTLKGAQDTQIQQLKEEEKLRSNINKGINDQVKSQRGLVDTRFDIVKQGFETPAETAAREFGEREEIIQEFSRQNAKNEEAAQDLSLENTKRFEDEKTAITAEAEKQRASLQSKSNAAQLGASGQLFGNLAQIAQAGGEEQFDNYKALASAQAVISTAQAVANALATPGIPFPLAAALAVTAGALGAVQIAQIQSQQYQPRALGGQMKAGGSFLVGERGPELVTMGNRNANITPNNQLGGASGGGQVTNVFQISAGVEGTVQAEIARFIPIFEQIAINSVNQSARRGGTTSRVLGRRR